MNNEETPLMRVITMDEALNISGGDVLLKSVEEKTYIRQSLQSGETLTLQGTLVTL